MFRNRELRVLFAAIFLISAVVFFLCFRLDAAAGMICAIGLFAVGGCCFLFTAYRYRKLRALSDAIRKMADGKILLDLRDNREGELSILKNDIYKLSARLSEQAAALEKEKSGMSDFLYDVSHQLKTPLTSLLMMSEILAQDSLPPEKRAEFLSTLSGGLLRMEWLVAALLKMAKLDVGAVAMKRQEIDAAALVEKALSPLAVLLDVKSQRVVVDKSAPVIMRCDIDWTAEALTNLIKNAAEHTAESGGEIKISFGENPIYTYIAVRDNGAGISAGDLPHVFERFYKGRQSGKDNAGIGLAMSLSIAQKQNGDLEVCSKPGEGAVFILKFYKTAV